MPFWSKGRTNSGLGNCALGFKSASVLAVIGYVTIFPTSSTVLDWPVPPNAWTKILSSKVISNVVEKFFLSKSSSYFLAVFGLNFLNSFVVKISNLFFGKALVKVCKLPDEKLTVSVLSVL